MPRLENRRMRLTSRRIAILGTVLVSGGIAWLLKLTVIALIVATGGRDKLETGVVAFFYLTALALLLIGSTGLRLCGSR